MVHSSHSQWKTVLEYSFSVPLRLQTQDRVRIRKKSHKVLMRFECHIFVSIYSLF